MAKKPILIGLCGLAGSGKSTAADYLVKKHGFVRLSYASPMKKMLLCLLTESGVGPITAKEMVYGNLKEVPHDALAGHTPRHSLQTLGTEWGRDCMAKDFWRRLLLRKVNDLTRAGISVVVDDVRFANEVEGLKAEGFSIVRIFRPGAGTSSTHSSEAQDLPVDAVIDNERELSFLHSRLDDLLSSLTPSS